MHRSTGKRQYPSTGKGISPKRDRAIYRIIDANANRLREGLRTMEEYFRFACTNKAFTRNLKSLRHQTTQALSSLDTRKLLAARDSYTDVGRETSERESQRQSLESTVLANLKRCQEATRVLEEYVKLINTATAEKFKKMRFGLYSIEKKVVLK